jgi:hypothetical protein
MLDIPRPTVRGIDDLHGCRADDVFTVRTYGDTPQPYGRPASGTVFGVSAATGAKVWSGTVGQATNGPVLSGIAIGGGLLVVPAGSTLTAFGN